MREVEELLGCIVKEKIKSSKTLFSRLMITQHEKAVAAKLNNLVNPQDSGNERREPSPISCLPTTHVYHGHTYTLECT